MTGIRLVNWHYFVNETIRLRGSTLVTGDNGAGKSTIFDAIQMVLIADQRRVRFNVSAHDETNRDLKGYLRCRTGRDDPDGDAAQGYLRGGDFTSYVALEFLDSGRSEHFVLGMAADTFAGEPDTPVFFRHSGLLDDALFVAGDRPLSVAEFRAALRQRRSSEVFGSIGAYRAAVLAQLGHLNDRFFSLVVKGLAFRPITRVREFVYDYLLDPREVKIDAMLENFRQYRHYDHLVQQTKEKLERLTEIASRDADRRELEKTAAVQQYVILRAARDGAQEDLDRLQHRQAEALRRRATADALGERLQGEIARLNAELRDLHDARARNKAYEAIQAIDRILGELSREAADLQRFGHRLSEEARTEIRALQAACHLAEAEPAALALADDAPLAVLSDSAERLARLAGGDIGAPLEDLSGLTVALDSLGDQVMATISRRSDEQAHLHHEQQALESALGELRRKRMKFPRPVESLREAITEAMPGTEARVLCELIDVPDETWHNAVEGYLNTQRFDLFVPEDRFDEALGVYEQAKHDRKIESVGLVNSRALVRSQPSAVPGSLAAEVTAADPAARAYIDRLLGRVMKCASEQQLKQYPVAITPTCMTYRNHTARQIEFHVYSDPYIGSRAIARQIQLKEQRLIAVAGRLEQLGAELATCMRFRGLLRGRDPVRFAEAWERLSRLPELRADIRIREQERAQIDVGELNALLQQIILKEKTQKRLSDQEKEALGDAREASAQLREIDQYQQAAQAAWRARQGELEQYALAHPELAEIGAARYLEALRRLSCQMIEQNFTGNRQGVLTQIDNLKQNLFRLRVEYNNRYQFGGAPDADDNATYAQEQEKLMRSELPAYEEKIGQARAAAEQEFKEHFVFKLQENIRLARQEFDSLNRVLRDIPFGQDHYQFVCSPDRAHRHFYDMIMDDFAMEGFNLFSEHFRQQHGETLDELFRLILEVPEDRQAENIRKYTDYRTYLEFDIKIHTNGETSSFSKVAREKSGGETQTPFYVAMIASFLQLYRPRQNPHSLRLLMFDEAFNRMDPDRAENTLQFIRMLGLQVLAAAPTDKCEIIAPHMETTLLAVRDGHRAWLEDYHQVLAAAPDSAESEAAATGEAIT